MSLIIVTNTPQPLLTGREQQEKSNSTLVSYYPRLKAIKSLVLALWLQLKSAWHTQSKWLRGGHRPGSFPSLSCMTLGTLPLLSYTPAC